MIIRKIINMNSRNEQKKNNIKTSKNDLYNNYKILKLNREQLYETNGNFIKFETKK